MLDNQGRCGLERTRVRARASCRDAPRLICWLLILSLLTFALPTYAFALDDDYRVLWGPTDVTNALGGGGGGHPIGDGTSGLGSGSSSQTVVYGTVTYALTKWDAALVLCGVSPTDSRLTDEVRTKLRTSSQGGAFYDLANTHWSIGTSSGFDMPFSFAAGSVQASNLYGVCSAAVALYGGNYVWACAYTDAQLTAARSALYSILDGGSGGGGSGGIIGGSGDYYVFTGNYEYYLGTSPSSTYQQQYITDGTTKWTTTTAVAGSNNYVLMPMPATVRVPKAMLAELMEHYQDGYDVYIYVQLYRGSLTGFEAYIGDITETTSTQGVDGASNEYVSSLTASGTFYKSVMQISSTNGYGISVDSSGVATFYGNSSTIHASAASSFSNMAYGRAYLKLTDDGGSGDEPDPVPEPTPTPDPPDPRAPSPPDLPDPGDPVQPPDPTPTTPVGPGNNITINITTTTDPTTTDYTDFFQAILDELQYFHAEQIGAMETLINALDAHCVHLQNRMSEVGNYVGGCVNNVIDMLASCFDNQNSYLQTLFDSLCDYLSDLAQWLVDNMRFENNVNVEPYDDSGLMYWLRRIWAKIGGDIINVKPSDPVTNWDPWAEWLAALVQHIIDMLTAGIGGAVTSAGGVLESLSHVFPFCVPFDMLLLVDAMTTTAVTPQISITLPETDWYDEYTIDIDCEPYDDAMEIVRSMELIAFVVYVMFHSDELFAWKPEEFLKWGAS